MASILPKTTALGYEKAAHLLRRSTFRFTKSMINSYATKTPQQALDQLFTFSAPHPITPRDLDGKIAYGNYYNQTYDSTASTANDAFSCWWIGNAMSNPTIEYRLSLWLHTIFINDVSFSNSFRFFDTMETFRFHTKGSIRELAFRITLNPNMLTYLNNNVNKVGNPNENYAREFLELFTILKGPQVSAGNYTNYTEYDVQQAARVLTGFTTSNSTGLHISNRLNSVDPVTKIPKGFVNENDHDKDNKVFSASFGNHQIIGGTTAATIEQELANFINMVFNQEETAKAYCRRLYRFFVGRVISTEIETDIIVELAKTLKNSDYNLEITVRELLTSQHFYDEDDSTHGDDVIGGLIKSPFELMSQLYSILEIPLPDLAVNPSAARLFNQLRVRNKSREASFPIFTPIDVNGYTGYSSNPDYDKSWISTSTLRARYSFDIENLIKGFTLSGFSFKLITPTFVKNSGYFSNPANADTLLQQFFDLLFVFTPVGYRFTYFRDKLLDGLSTINWQNEWNAYLSTNDDSAVKISLDRLVISLVKSPEYQIF